MRRWVLLLVVAAGAFAAVLVVSGRGLSSIAPPLEIWTMRPRVLAGGDGFETLTVTERAGSRLTGEFDGEPGDDLAVVEFGSVQLLTPATLAERQRLELGGDARSRWTPASRLVRLGGALVVVDTGGGLDETRVLDPDGTERWRYHSSLGLVPTSLVPADLDGDGDAEFYLTIDGTAARLDAHGQEVWRAPFVTGRIVATAARTRRDPGWIVAEGHGQTVVWDSDGTQLASLTMKDARPLAVIDREDGRFLLTGGPALHAVGLDGHVVFDWTIEGTTVADALPLLLQPGTPPAIALVAFRQEPVARWRLQIVSADRTLLYDELLDTSPALLKARGADGVDRLFLNRASLLALRRREQ